MGILRGDFVAWAGNSQNGSLTLRNADNRLLECSFDDKTWFERENERIGISSARAGDHLEIVADHQPPSTACYARTVQILDVTLPRHTASGKPRLRLHNTAATSPSPVLSRASTANG